MSIQGERGSAEFEPVKLRPSGRRIDPVVVGLLLVVAALVLAVVKPWDDGSSDVAGVPSPVTSSASPEPTAISSRGALVPPTWADVRGVVSRRPAWGIRTIVIGSPGAASPGTSDRYAERWFAATNDGGEDSTVIANSPDGTIVALGVTFPPEETPLAVRIWLDHGEGGLEWMDARPVDDVPARGAYLFLRPSVAGAAVRSWAPGRYRVDVLVGGGIKRIDALIYDTSGKLPSPDPWARVVPRIVGFDASGLDGLPPGSFAGVDGAAIPFASTAGPPLDETGAWLDVDREATGLEPRSFVARTYQPDATRLGVVLPPASTIRTADLRRLAPFDDTPEFIAETRSGSPDSVSFAAFATPGDAPWRPGVYAMSVSWTDPDGAHDRTWHIELRPGPLRFEPVLLSTMRAWASYAGSSGVLLGTTVRIFGDQTAPGIRLVGINPQPGTRYPGLSGTDLIGCGETVVRGRPEVIGIVGPAGSDLTPVASRILYPFADAGPLAVLTAADAVPGLTLVAPLLTAEFGGAASYGFRAGSSPDAPGYTICIGLVAPVG